MVANRLIGRGDKVATAEQENENESIRPSGRATKIVAQGRLFRSKRLYIGRRHPLFGGFIISKIQKVDASAAHLYE